MSERRTRFLIVSVSTPQQEVLDQLKSFIETIDTTDIDLKVTFEGQTTPFSNNSTPTDARHSLVWNTPLLGESAIIRVTTESEHISALTMNWVRSDLLPSLYAHPMWSKVQERMSLRGHHTTLIALPAGSSK